MVPPYSVVEAAVPPSSCRLPLYVMCLAGAREYFRPGYWRLQSAFEVRDRGQERQVSTGHQYRDLTCMWYRSDIFPGRDAGGTFEIDLEDGDGFPCCSYDKMNSLGGSRACVLVNVGVRHRRKGCQVRSLNSHSQ